LAFTFFLLPCTAAAQQPAPESLLPNPRLSTITPPGGKAGTTVEVTFTGTDLEEPEALLFSHPTLKAEPVLPPAPPVDPKKPAPKPAPKPPVTKFKVTIPADAPLGCHDVRLVGKYGVSNPRAFVIGDLPEVAEKEPNNDVQEAQRVALNSTVNGALASPVDVDYFVFAGKKGQRVVISCLASGIDSRMHPALELYDAAGRQLAFNRQYQGDDALVDCTLAADGDYYVRLFEFTHAEGTPEHYYRLTISTAPWIDAVFPPAIEPGKTATLTVYGRNLPDGKPDPSAVVDGRVLEKVSVNVTAPADPQAVQRLSYSGRLSPLVSGQDGFEYRVRNASGASNPVLLTYARAPVVLDNGANHTPETAQEVPVPCEVAGRIDNRGDRDWYSFTAKKDQVYSIEVLSDRLGCAADMYFLLWNPAAKAPIGEFDDNPELLTPIKFFTRSEDPPRYRFAVPADGKYQIMVRNQGIGAGPRCYYRLRIAPEQPDFRLVILPASDTRPDACRLLQGGQEVFTVLVWRLDGFNGNVTLTAEGLPAGVTCPPQTVGTGFRETLLVLSAAAAAKPGAYPFKVKGTATINGQPVVREARPASATWPVVPGQGVPVISRLDRALLLAVRDQAPFSLTAAIDKPIVIQGDKANITLKLARLWPDCKTPPLQVLVNPTELPPNLTVNNNQPVAMNPGKDSATLAVNVNAAVLPGTYNIVLRGVAQVPYNKDPMAKQKQPTNVVAPSTPVAITVLPKQVATVTLANANLTAKVGSKNEVVVKVARMFDYDGEFKVQLVVPPAIKGVSAAEMTIPPGKDEVKLTLAVAADAAPGNRPDLVVRAVAMVNGKVPTAQETKLTVNVVK
jgi:hypothetical protein